MSATTPRTTPRLWYQGNVDLPLDEASIHPSKLVLRQRRYGARTRLESSFEADAKSTSIRCTRTLRTVFQSCCQINVDPLHDDASIHPSKLIPRQCRYAACLRLEPPLKSGAKATLLRSKTGRFVPRHKGDEK
jgi:hypothetical protein